MNCCTVPGWRDRLIALNGVPATFIESIEVYDPQMKTRPVQVVIVDAKDWTVLESKHLTESLTEQPA